MNPCYLRSLSVFGFRVFPEAGVHFDLEGPGITILVGQNGLGKSSFFEAIEWAITGRVARLGLLSAEVGRKENVASYYAQRSEENADSIANIIKAQLRFDSDGEVRTIGRCWERVPGGSKFRPSEEPTDAEIRSVLCNEGWGADVVDIGSYLHDTHFLSQSASNRWATLSPKDRWERLEGPAGFGRLEHVRSGLGQSTKIAFGKAIKACNAKVDEARQRLIDWQLLLDKVANKREFSARVGVPSARQVQEATEILIDDLRELLRNIPSGSVQLVQAENIDLSEALALIRHVEQVFAQRGKVLDGVSEMPGKARAARMEIGDIRMRLSLCADSIGKIDGQIAVVEAQFADVRASLSNAKKNGADARASSETVQRLRGHFAERPKVEAALSNLRVLLAQSDAELVSSSSSVSQLSVALGSAMDAQKKLSDAGKRAESCRRLYERVSLWAREVGSAQVKRDELNSVAQELSELERSLVVGQRQAEVATKAEVDAASYLQNMRIQRDDTVQAMSKVLLRIAPDSCECPICHTTFEVGELFRRAMSEAELTDPNVAAAQEQHICAVKVTEEARRCVASLQELVRRAEERFAELRRFVLAHDAELESLRGTDEAAGLTAESSALVLNRIESFCGAADAEVERWTSQVDDTSVIREELAQAESMRRRVEREGLRLRHEADERLLLLRSIDDAMDLHRDVVAPWILDPSKVDISVALSLQQVVEADEVEQSAVARMRVLDRELEDAKRQRLELVRLQDTDQRLLRARESFLEMLLTGWRAAGLLDSIDEASIEQGRQALAFGREKLAGLDARARGLREDWTQLQAAEEHDAEQLRVAATIAKASCASAAEYTSFLDAEVVRASAEKAIVDRAEELSSRLAARLKEDASEYATNVIGPLNDQSDRFHLALSPFPERMLVLGPRTTVNSATSLNLNVRLHRSDTSSDELAAHLMLSEGQLSAASLSILFGMSTAYRWSRWRALLLDDPLQQNDVVHVSSFVDVARRLVLEDKYQIFVSTHDSDMADFMLRKSRASGVKCSMIRFTNPGRPEARR